MKQPSIEKQKRIEDLKEQAYIVIFEAETPAGKLFDIALLVAIMASVGITMLMSVESIRTLYGPWMTGLNWIITLLFTIEYGLRLYCARKPRRYARSFFGVVDFLALLPTYLGLFINNAGFLDVIRVLRLLRIFRVLKMVQFVDDSDLLLNSLLASRRRIGIFLFVVLTLVVILGSLMYVVEGADSGFTSIPRGVYWAIVTLTTVGYGDIAPRTPIGQALASCIMIIGYSIIAVPTGIVTAEIGMAHTKHKSSLYCPACHNEQHDPDATCCKYCGKKLIPHDETQTA